jgi:hypothetical protein
MCSVIIKLGPEACVAVGCVTVSCLNLGIPATRIVSTCLIRLNHQVTEFASHRVTDCVIFASRCLQQLLVLFRAGRPHILFLSSTPSAKHPSWVAHDQNIILSSISLIAIVDSYTSSRNYEERSPRRSHAARLSIGGSTQAEAPEDSAV